MSNDLYSISEIAAMFGVSTRTIRYYEEIGLLKPKRNHNGHRKYGKKEKIQLQLIFRGKKYGFSLDEIKDMILLFEKDPTGREQLKKTIEYGEDKLHEVTQRLEELMQLRREMEQYLDVFRKTLDQLGEENR
ncbi:MerR family transcriptional regulator [Tenuibacillus multivorans]|uniref:DNA-binding transcriptional regulator, MerR family n=1 Tax=Tenuibacillus multivorans TaxID=237069 RepID=A0A1H0DCU8_9BACI|nr:MerR family transcriptional regulator [Tenuibacillus multivorans]GEL76609.1 MerR family transcriptional regulator [Tenuibacillus multivorans]SDN67816.1 DNA-binding transcriptional regulator, MerR family [Tenuibacillus multivorans]